MHLWANQCHCGVCCAEEWQTSQRGGGLWQGKTGSILRFAPNSFCKPDAESALQFQAVQFPSQPHDRPSAQLLLPQLHRHHLFLSPNFYDRNKTETLPKQARYQTETRPRHDQDITPMQLTILVGNYQRRHWLSELAILTCLWTRGSEQALHRRGGRHTCTRRHCVSKDIISYDLRTLLFPPLVRALRCPFFFAPTLLG